MVKYFATKNQRVRSQKDRQQVRPVELAGTWHILTVDSVR
jgi:hypothetical protein